MHHNYAWCIDLIPLKHRYQHFDVSFCVEVSEKIKMPNLIFCLAFPRPLKYDPPMMTNDQAVVALAALAQETRLNIFRLLVRAGPDGLVAGKIAELTGKSPSGLSFHLKEMTFAGLLRARQEGRFVVYMADYARVNALTGFLMEHCCEGAEVLPIENGEASSRCDGKC